MTRAELEGGLRLLPIEGEDGAIRHPAGSEHLSILGCSCVDVCPSKLGVNDSKVSEISFPRDLLPLCVRLAAACLQLTAAPEG